MSFRIDDTACPVEFQMLDALPPGELTLRITFPRASWEPKALTLTVNETRRFIDWLDGWRRSWADPPSPPPNREISAYLSRLHDTFDALEPDGTYPQGFAAGVAYAARVAAEMEGKQ